jgi:hypothetical protein
MGEHNCFQGDVGECIKKKAYEIWEKNGCKPGRDLEYWLIAEKTVKAPIKKQQPKN